jgi:hypothetical protein|tara:strand:+ start:17107 stop:17283 length:177 start_codon:yes stop_codon:yes gene_type:complete
MIMVKVKELPVVLVKTWIELARNNNGNAKVQTRALSMLRKKVGSPEKIKYFMQNNNIV